MGRKAGATQDTGTTGREVLGQRQTPEGEKLLFKPAVAKRKAIKAFPALHPGEENLFSQAVACGCRDDHLFDI
jgi:hypothetical protein